MCGVDDTSFADYGIDFVGVSPDPLWNLHSSQK